MENKKSILLERFNKRGQLIGFGFEKRPIPSQPKQQMCTSVESCAAAQNPACSTGSGPESDVTAAWLSSADTPAVTSLEVSSRLRFRY